MTKSAEKKPHNNEGGGEGDDRPLTDLQVYPGYYMLLDSTGTTYGVMMCDLDGTEYYGVLRKVGGKDAGIGSKVQSLVWLGTNFFTGIDDFRAYCNTKNYNLRIKAMCTEAPW